MTSWAVLMPIMGLVYANIAHDHAKSLAKFHGFISLVDWEAAE